MAISNNLQQDPIEKTCYNKLFCIFTLILEHRSLYSEMKDTGKKFLHIFLDSLIFSL